MYIFNSFYLLHSYNPSVLICLCFNMVFFRGNYGSFFEPISQRGGRGFPLGLDLKNLQLI